MRRLVYAFVVRMQQNQVFSRRGPYFEYMFGRDAFLNVLIFNTPGQTAHIHTLVCAEAARICNKDQRQLRV